MTTHVPDEEVDTFGFSDGAFDFLTIEADRGDGVEVLVELEAVERGGLAGGVEAEHDDVQRALCGGQRVEQARVLAHVGTHSASGGQLSDTLVRSQHDEHLLSPENRKQNPIRSEAHHRLIFGTRHGMTLIIHCKD